MFLTKQMFFTFEGSSEAPFKMKAFSPQEILKQQSLRMFELVQKHPPHWPPFVPPAKPEVTTTGAGAARAGTAGARQHLPWYSDHRGNNCASLRPSSHQGVKCRNLREHQTVLRTGHVTIASTDMSPCSFVWFLILQNTLKDTSQKSEGFGLWF